LRRNTLRYSWHSTSQSTDGLPLACWLIASAQACGAVEIINDPPSAESFPNAGDSRPVLPRPRVIKQIIPLGAPAQNPTEQPGSELETPAAPTTGDNLLSDAASMARQLKALEGRVRELESVKTSAQAETKIAAPEASASEAVVVGSDKSMKASHPAHPQAAGQDRRSGR
jgi:hypothetical protein